MEPFKNRIDAAVIDGIAERIPGNWDRAGFRSMAKAGLQDLELKARVVQLADALQAALPQDYPTALGLIIEGLHEGPDRVEGLTDDWGAWPLCTFVERHGGQHPEVSLAALPTLTKHWSCEFAVRPFFAQDPERVAREVEVWSRDPNVHVRRLASEGTRPRLPWGIRLRDRIERPERLLAVLERLRDDPEEYVRRSVANHLNDIAKDHPEWVLEVCGGWSLSADKNRKRLVKHALRTLIKSGEPRAYGLIGLEPYAGTAQIELETARVPIGGAVVLHATLTGGQAQRVRLDLGVHHLKKNGSHTVKVFHWTERSISAGQTLALRRSQPMKKVSTRKLYPGEHRIDLRINGAATVPIAFELKEI